MNTLQNTLEVLEQRGCKPTKSGNGYNAFCPIHEADGRNHTKSLSIAEGDKQPVLMTCHAGCTYQQIADALGLTGVSEGEQLKRKIVATYDYHDLDGNLVSQKIRYEPKDFRQRWPDGIGGWLWKKPKDAPNVLYRLPEINRLGTILVVEGEKDANRLAELGFCATTTIEGAAKSDQRAKWKKEYTAQLSGAARVVLIPDNDEPGRAHMDNIARQLQGKVSDLRLLELPGLPEKGDISDWLNQGHTLEELTALVKQAPVADVVSNFSPIGETIPQAESQSRPAPDTEAPYSQTAKGTWWRKSPQEWVFLANFKARIITEVVIDDGAECKRQMEIAGTVENTPLPTVKIPCGQFAGMSWVGSEWGSVAQIAPGFGLKDQLRYAIQVLSPAVTYQTIYEHTGWREIGGQWVYLSQGGVIGAQGAIKDIDVALTGSIADFALALPDNASIAIHASLQMLECAAPSIAVPLFLAPYRALICEALSGDFSMFLSGVTGSRKTEAAALVQAHFGPRWHGKHLPGSWSSTANSLERSAFQAKDAVMVIDDFCPNGTKTDVARFHKDADRVLRAQGNQAGRQRMNPDGTLRPVYFPRGLVVATGEDIPHGQSLRGRMLILEFTAETVSLPVLTALQQSAGTGRLAEAAGSFCQWLAPRLPALKKQLPERRNQLRNDINTSASAHSRHPDTLAGLMITAELFADFAAERGVALPSDWLTGITTALMQTGKEQQQAIAAEEPAARFVRLISSALAAGRCHLKPVDGQPLTALDDFTGYGWQLRTFGVGSQERTDWHECGPAIGRFKPNEPWGVYLDPEASYALAQRIAEEQGQAIPLQQRSLVKALYAKGYLLSRNEPHFTVKVKLPDRSAKRFLHLRVSSHSSGNSGNYGNHSTQPDDFEDEKPVPTNQNEKTLVGTVGTGNDDAGCCPVPTNQRRFPLIKWEWEPKNTPNPLPDNDNFKPVSTVPTVPTNPDNGSPGVNINPLLTRIVAVLESAGGGGMTAVDLARVVDSGKTGPALVEAAISRLLLEGKIGRINGRFVAQP